MKILSAISFLLLIITGCSISAEKGKDSEIKPTSLYNFVVIFADDLGYGDLGVFGHPTIHTPHLDQMAQEGQKWTQFYVGASVCTPSRAALLTGRLAVRSGMTSKNNRVLFPDSHHGLPQTEITLAEQLKNAGYVSGIIGKWHLGHKKEYLPTQHGFESYFGIPYSNDMDNVSLLAKQDYSSFWTSEARKKTESFNVPLMRNEKIIERPTDQFNLTKRYTQEALLFIEKHKNQPFFLYLAHSMPHVPLFASESFEGKSKRGIYGDVVEELDHSVGQILNLLKNHGLEKNTIVVFTSDNGPWLVMNSEGGSAGLLRSGKGSTWEGGMREPTLFWSPGNIIPGVVSELGTTMDLFTTFSALANVPLPNDRILDGVDLSPVLFHKKESPRKTVFYYRGDELYALRLKGFKAHFKTQDPYSNFYQTHQPPLLFNLNVDPSEKFDVANEHPEILDAIMEIRLEHNKKMIKGPDLLRDRG
ncbi:MAG: hypothetical protein RLZZ248_750 [Bacteroidota bacterium]